MGFPVRTKGTGNTEHMFSQWGLVGTGNREQGKSQSSEARRPAGPPEAKLPPQKKISGGGILKGTGNREHGTGNMPCSPSVPGTCSGTTPGKPIAEVLVYYSIKLSCSFLFDRICHFQIISLNLCQIEASCLKSHHKVKNLSSSISKWCMSHDRQRRAINSNFFFFCALASNKFVCLANKQGFSWVRQTANDFSIRLNLCVAACCSVSWRY